MGDASHPSPSSELDSDRHVESFSLLADVVGQFIAAWDADEGPPNLKEFLPEGDLRRMLLVELIKVDLEYRWGQGLEKRIAEYLAEHPELAAAGVPVELLYEEFHARQQSGDDVDPAEYARDYPDHEETLRQWLGAGDYESTVIVKPSEQNVLQSIEAGEKVDDFDLILRLGKGAFAHVYLARQRSMQRLVALKVSADSGAEPQTLAQLDHDAIVRVFDQHVLEDRKLRLLYMQYLPGGTLQTLVKRVQRSNRSLLTGQLLLDVVDETIEAKGEVKPAESDQRKMLATLSWSETVAWIGARLAEGLDYAHGRGVLHRDIKPANVLLSGEGAPKLADFNISFAGGVSGQSAAAYFGGSLAYMSTEQLEACHHGMPRQARELDGRSDVYSLGVMLWELLTGEKPFRDGKLDGGWNEVVEKMLHRRIRNTPENADQIPPSLRRVLLKCLTRHRDERWQSGKELAWQFELCLDEDARQLLDPPATSWPVRCRRCAVPIVLLAILIPNALAGWFNVAYNVDRHVENLPEAARAVFWKMVWIVNGILYPLGSALVIWLTARVVGGLKRMNSSQIPSVDEAFAYRRECLRLGERCSMMCLSLWTVAGIAHPLAIRYAHQALGMADMIHWFGSLVICGLISVAYPFFGVTYFAVRSLYPALLHYEPLGENDQREVLRLDRRLGPYLVAAGAVPLISIGAELFSIRPGQAITSTSEIIGWLCVGGIAGSVVVYFGFFGRLQRYLQALLRMVRK